MEKKIIILLAIIVVILIISIEIKEANYQRELANQTTHENVFKAKYQLLERQLTESQQLRLVLGHRFDSINHHTQTLVRTNRALDSALSKVNGKYRERTVTELETEMIKRFNAAQ